MSQSQAQPLQQQPQPQQPPPVLVYPNTVTGQPPSHDSDGSFGTVFIVLAVIVVLSAIACVLGRLCNRRFQRQGPKQSNGVLRKGRDSNVHFTEGDIEFGFDKKFASAREGVNGGNRGFKQFENGGMRGEIKPADLESSKRGHNNINGEH